MDRERETNKLVSVSLVVIVIILLVNILLVLFMKFDLFSIFAKSPLSKEEVSMSPCKLAGPPSEECSTNDEGVSEFGFMSMSCTHCETRNACGKVIKASIKCVAL